MIELGLRLIGCCTIYMKSIPAGREADVNKLQDECTCYEKVFCKISRERL